jgi:hypothetical protein
LGIIPLAPPLLLARPPWVVLLKWYSRISAATREPTPARGGDREEGFNRQRYLLPPSGLVEDPFPITALFTILQNERERPRQRIYTHGAFFASFLVRPSERASLDDPLAITTHGINPVDCLSVCSLTSSSDANSVVVVMPCCNGVACARERERMSTALTQQFLLAALEPNMLPTPCFFLTIRMVF